MPTMSARCRRRAISRPWSPGQRATEVLGDPVGERGEGRLGAVVFGELCEPAVVAGPVEHRDDRGPVERLDDQVIGHPLGWIDLARTFDVWKAEVHGHLATPGLTDPLGRFPGGYCYVVSLWTANGAGDGDGDGDGGSIVLPRSITEDSRATRAKRW